ncbi:hypothetical protein ACOMHN_003740 [Nucella lapillus]
MTSRNKDELKTAREGCYTSRVKGLREVSSDDRNEKDGQEREDEEERRGTGGTKMNRRNEDDEQERGGRAGTGRTSRNGEDEQDDEQERR